jgi:hypothetical protein
MTRFIFFFLKNRQELCHLLRREKHTNYAYKVTGPRKNKQMALAIEAWVGRFLNGALLPSPLTASSQPGKYKTD